MKRARAWTSLPSRQKVRGGVRDEALRAQWLRSKSAAEFRPAVRRAAKMRDKEQCTPGQGPALCPPWLIEIMFATTLIATESQAQYLTFDTEP